MKVNLIILAKKHKREKIKMKKKSKYDFLAINKRMNGNWNGGDNPFVGPTKNITKGEELKMLNKLQRTAKCKSR